MAHDPAYPHPFSGQLPGRGPKPRAGRFAAPGGDMTLYMRPAPVPEWVSGPANDNGPRLLTREQAATYCGYSRSGFSRLVAMGALPGPVPGLSRWDKRAIDARLDKFSGLERNDEPMDALEAWERQRAR